jgi:hypothetical protein
LQLEQAGVLMEYLIVHQRKRPGQSLVLKNSQVDVVGRAIDFPLRDAEISRACDPFHHFYRSCKVPLEPQHVLQQRFKQ